MEDTLIIGYDSNEPNDIPVLTVARVKAGRVCVLNDLIGSDAKDMYQILAGKSEEQQ